MRVARVIVLAISVTAGALLVPAVAVAHDMNATVTVKPDGTRVEVFFEEDLPAEFAQVRVTDFAGTEVAKGTTDERGVWMVPALPPGAYELSAKSTGHIAAVKFVIPGEPEAAPVSHTGFRLNKTLGLTAGTGGLLGVSAVFWLRRRRRE